MKPLRKRLYRDPAIGELARDVDDSLAVIRDFEFISMRVIVRDYREPMFIASERQPSVVMAARVQLDATPAAVVPFGSTSWTYDAQGGRVVVNDVAGLTLGTRYRIMFLVMG